MQNVLKILVTAQKRISISVCGVRLLKNMEESTKISKNETNLQFFL